MVPRGGRLTNHGRLYFSSESLRSSYGRVCVFITAYRRFAAMRLAFGEQSLSNNDARPFVAIS
jgi:hypothetical protein